MHASRERELRLALRELEFLQRLSQSAASTMDSQELVDLIIRETTSAIGTDVCSLYLVNPGGRDLSLIATNGLNERMIGRVLMKVGEGVTGWVAEMRQPTRVLDVALEPHWQWVPGLDEERFTSMLSVPIESGPRLVGVLNVQSVERREFTQEDIDFLRAIAGQVAGILERSELQRRLEAQLTEIQLSHDIHERFTRLSLEGAGIPAILGALRSPARAALPPPPPDRGRHRLAGRRPVRALLVRGLPDPGHGGGRRAAPAADPAAAGRAQPRRARGARLRRPAADARGSGARAGVDGPCRRRAREQGATLLAGELAKERAAAEVERRLRGDLVEEVLAGGLDAEESERLARQAERARAPPPAQAVGC